MNTNNTSTKVAILATDGFEQAELEEPKNALQQAGIETCIVSLEGGKIQGYNHAEKGDQFDVDLTLDQAAPDDFAALVLPGGVHNPDTLRTESAVIDFVKAFFAADKPVAAVCHAPWILIEAGVVEGRRMTSYHSIVTDVKNAGANWVDEEVVIDGNLITSRNPDDLPAFNEALIEALDLVPA